MKFKHFILMTSTLFSLTCEGAFAMEQKDEKIKLSTQIKTRILDDSETTRASSLTKNEQLNKWTAGTLNWESLGEGARDWILYTNLDRAYSCLAAAKTVFNDENRAGFQKSYEERLCDLARIPFSEVIQYAVQHGPFYSLTINREDHPNYTRWDDQTERSKNTYFSEIYEELRKRWEASHSSDTYCNYETFKRNGWKVSKPSTNVSLTSNRVNTKKASSRASSTKMTILPPSPKETEASKKNAQKQRKRHKIKLIGQLKKRR
jgi:hypothetical protein